MASKLGMMIGPVIAVILMMLWGFAFWGYLYAPFGVFKDHPPGFGEVAEVLKDSDLQTGTYFYPWPRQTPQERDAWIERHKAGPFFLLSFVREGHDPAGAQKLVWGTLLYLVVACLAAFLLSQVRYVLPNLVAEILFVFFAGSLGSLYTHLSDIIWFHLPSHFTLAVLFYELVMWLILGISLAICSRLFVRDG